MPQNARRNSPQFAAKSCKTLQNAAKRRKTPQNAAKRRKTLQNATIRRNSPQNAAIFRNLLQNAAERRNSTKSGHPEKKVTYIFVLIPSTTACYLTITGYGFFLGALIGPYPTQRFGGAPLLHDFAKQHLFHKTQVPNLTL
jgi:hypothetical protein